MLVVKKNENDLKCVLNNGTAFISSFNVDGTEVILLRKPREINLYQNSIMLSSVHHLKYNLVKNDNIGKMFILENKSFSNSASYKGEPKQIKYLFVILYINIC